MPVPRVTLLRPFVADHFHDLPGFVEARHGHNWMAEATAEAQTPERETALAAALDRWVAGLDYSLLNDQGRLSGRNPTAEALAQWLLEDLEAQGFTGVEVRLREKANYWAACRREAL